MYCMHTTVQKIIQKLLKDLCSPSLYLFDKKYSKNCNIVVLQ